MTITGSPKGSKDETEQELRSMGRNITSQAGVSKDGDSHHAATEDWLTDYIRLQFMGGS